MLNPYKILLRFTSFLVLTFFVGCQKKQEVNIVPYKLPTQVESGTIIYGEKTLVVNDQNSKSLTKITDTSLEFSTGSVADNITTGQILMSGITQEAPQGYLRKVTAVQKNSSSVVLQTTNATFEDAIKECHLKYTKALSKSARIDATQAMFEIPFRYEWDRDNDKSTISDNITFEGSLKIDPDLKFEMDIENFTLKNLVNTLKISNVGELKITLGGKVGDIADVLKVADGFQIIPEITLPPYVILGTPITFFNKVRFIVGIDGEISAKVKVNATLTGSVEAGIKYTDYKGIEYVNEVDNKLEVPTPTFEGKASLEPWLQVRLQSSPFDMKDVRVFIAARASVKAEATINPSAIDIGVKIGTKLYANAQMKIFSKTLIQPIDFIFFDKYFDTPLRWQFPLAVRLILSSPRIEPYNVCFAGSQIIRSFPVGIKNYGVCWSSVESEPTINSPSVLLNKTFLESKSRINASIEPKNLAININTTDGTGKYSNYNFLDGKTYYIRLFAETDDDAVLYSDVQKISTIPIKAPNFSTTINSITKENVTFTVDLLGTGFVNRIQAQLVSDTKYLWSNGYQGGVLSGSVVIKPFYNGGGFVDPFWEVQKCTDNVLEYPTGKVQLSTKFDDQNGKVTSKTFYLEVIVENYTGKKSALYTIQRP